MIAYDGQKAVVSPLVIHLADPTPYEYDIFASYKYNATMVEDGKEVYIPAFSSIVNIIDVSGVTQSGWVFADATSKRARDVVIEVNSRENSCCTSHPIQ